MNDSEPSPEFISVRAGQNGALVKWFSGNHVSLSIMCFRLHWCYYHGIRGQKAPHKVLAWDIAIGRRFRQKATRRRTAWQGTDQFSQHALGASRSRAIG